MSLTKTEKAALQAVLRATQALSNPANPQCALSPEIKEAVRVYVSTWITPGLALVLKPAAERTFTDNDLLAVLAREPR